MIECVKKKSFGKLAVGDSFFIKKTEHKIVECEKLSNNLCEDYEGNPILLSYSDVVIVDYVNN